MCVPLQEPVEPVARDSGFYEDDDVDGGVSDFSSLAVETGLTEEETRLVQAVMILQVCM